ncbi:hypothetical protein WICMUC_004164 [Wickerhamomyces mucosus]|uniref:VASt domain-containing protein n=1 Tax=Wickerhamomyces mucosus TaxID=1378264 RepID=A0A9P8PIB4_9ASCO|nr:hypothetical protein WICMUC_004164 [Wickerhamomyces mucosus]
MDLLDDPSEIIPQPSPEELPVSHTTGFENTEVTDEKENDVDLNAEDLDEDKVYITEQPKQIELEPPIDIVKRSSNALTFPRISDSVDESTPSSSPAKPTFLEAPVPTVIPARSSSALYSQYTMSMSPVAKSLPAGPLTTKEDALPHTNSSNSSLNDTNSIADSLQQINQKPSTPNKVENFKSENGGGFFNNVLSAAANSLSLKKKDELEFKNENDDTMTTTSCSSNSKGTINTNSENSSAISTSSPNMMSYRKGKKGKRRGTSVSSLDNQLNSPLKEAEKPPELKTLQWNNDDNYNQKLYIDKKFDNTSYRYAADDRNNDFHNIFKSIPKSERLIDDFSCALSREILLQGRLYVSENNLCFNSNLLGWITNLIISFKQVESFEKTATAGLFPNGIAINLKEDGVRHSFASFVSRDTIYNFLLDILKVNSRNNFNSIDSEVSADKGDEFGSSFISKNLAIVDDSLFDKEYNSALMSIDGDTPGIRRTYSESTQDQSDETDGDDDDDDEDGLISSSSRSDIKSEISSEEIFKLRDKSTYSYKGPYSHYKTYPNTELQNDNEITLASETFNCPPGILFEILFGENTEFTLDFLKDQDSSEFSEISKYEPNGQSLKERQYDYKKALNFPVGPKSTTCYVKELINFENEEKYFDVINITQTPDVPSGKSFDVRTRYMISWGDKNNTDLVVSFWVNWTGSSWMKGVIDKSCKTGQEAATKSLLRLINDYLDEHIVETSEIVKNENQVEIEDIKEGKAAAIVKDKRIIENINPVSRTSEKSNVGVGISLPNFFGELSLYNVVVLGFLSIITFLQFLILKNVSIIPHKTAFSLNSIDPIDQQIENKLFQGQEILIWNWIDERDGRLKGTKSDRVQVLKTEIDDLISSWARGELNTKEGKQLIRRFEEDLNKYTKVAIDNNEAERVNRANSLREAIRALL